MAITMQPCPQEACLCITAQQSSMHDDANDENDIHRASTGRMSARDLLRRIAYHDGNSRGKEVLCVSSALPCTGVVVARKLLVRSMPQLLCPGVGRDSPSWYSSSVFFLQAPQEGWRNASEGKRLRV